MKINHLNLYIWKNGALFHSSTPGVSLIGTLEMEHPIPFIISVSLKGDLQILIRDTEGRILSQVFPPPKEGELAYQTHASTFYATNDYFYGLEAFTSPSGKGCLLYTQTPAHDIYTGIVLPGAPTSEQECSLIMRAWTRVCTIEQQIQHKLHGKRN